MGRVPTSTAEGSPLRLPPDDTTMLLQVAARTADACHNVRVTIADHTIIVRVTFVRAPPIASCNRHAVVMPAPGTSPVPVPTTRHIE